MPSPLTFLHGLQLSLKHLIMQLLGFDDLVHVVYLGITIGWLRCWWLTLFNIRIRFLQIITTKIII